MAHEKSITVTLPKRAKGKQIFNLDTVVGGKQLTPKQAIDMFKSGKIKALGGPFKTIKQGVSAAGARSRSFNFPKNPSFRRFK